MIFGNCMIKLQDRFGVKAFDKHIIEIIWDTVKDVEDTDGTWIQSLVREFIGKRKHTMPPLEPDFREAVHAYLKTKRESSRFEYMALMRQREQDTLDQGDGSDGGWKKSAKALDVPSESVSCGDMVEILILKKRVNKSEGRDEYDGLEVFEKATGG